jgi:hypothetical protein
MLGDNESVVNTASMPHSKLEQATQLSYHKTRCIAGSVTIFPYPWTNKSADILKHWDMAKCLADHAPLPRIGRRKCHQDAHQAGEAKVANVLCN